MTEFERDVRVAVYDTFVQAGAVPTVDGLAARLDTRADAVENALRALADAHAVVLQPGSSRVWMAHPFSGVPTGFVAAVGDRRWFANCAWDALSIVGLLGGTGHVDARSPVNGSPIGFDIRDHVVHGEGVVHFLVPASRFWEDIGFT